MYKSIPWGCGVEVGICKILKTKRFKKNCILNDDDDDDGNNGEDDGPVLSQGSWDLDPEGSSPSYRGKWLQTHHHTYAFAHICTLFYTFAHFYTFAQFYTFVTV